MLFALALIVYVGVKEEPDMYCARSQSGFREVEGFQAEEILNAEALLGVEKVCRWTIDDVKPDDDCLAFLWCISMWMYILMMC